MSRCARPPGAASAPRNRARARFLTPGGGCYAPPLKTALRVRFARLTPQGAAAPRLRRFPLLSVYQKNMKLAVVCRCPRWPRLKDEVFRRNAEL
jgi:hypothetical protein